MPLGPEPTPEEQALVERLSREGKLVARPPGWTPPPFNMTPLGSAAPCHECGGVLFHKDGCSGADENRTAQGRAPVARTPEAIAQAAPADIARFCSEEAVAEVLTVWQEVIAERAARTAELEAALWQIVNNAEAWHGDDAAKGRALAVIALTGRTALNATR